MPVFEIRVPVTLRGFLQEFYHETHRPSHFLSFSQMENEEGADREDMFQ